MKFKVKQEKQEPETQARQYPEPDRIEKLFNAYKKGRKEALVKALKEKQ